MKITVMGEEIEEHSLPEPEPALEYHFADVEVTPRAINAASRVVPQEVYKVAGLHAWLTQRANTAFKERKTIGTKEVILGKLKYVFSAEGDLPILYTVILVP